MILAALALALLPRQDGKLWSFLDSRETDSGPRLELELADGTTRVVEAAAVAGRRACRPAACHPALAQLAVDMGDRNRALVRWDLAPGFDVVRARWHFVTHPSERLPPRAEHEIGLHVVAAPWEEATACWSRQPAFAEEPIAAVTLGPDERTHAVDLTELVRAWVSGERANQGLLLRAVAPIPVLDSPAPASEASADLDGELLALLDWAPSSDEALARARREKREVLLVVAGAFGGESIAEHERLLLATLFAHPHVRAAVAERTVPLRVRVSPALVALALEGEDVHAHPLTLLGIALADCKPPALVRCGPDGSVRAILTGFAACDPHRLLAWLGAPERERDPGMHAALAHLDSGRLAEGEAALAARADDPEAQYWAAVLAAARGEDDARDVRLARIAPDAPWALAGRILRAYPELVAGYQTIWSAAAPSGAAAVAEPALAYLLRCQRADGSFPMGHPNYEEHREGITALCALALLVYGEDEAAARAHGWLAARLAGRPLDEVNSFTATYALELALGRVARGAERAEVAEAIARLAGGQLPGGAWSYSRAFGASWRGGFGGWPVTEHGRAHSMNTAIALEALTRAVGAGFAVAPEVLERGRDALLAMRSGPGAYTYTWPEPVIYSTVDASIARAPAAETALARLDAVPRADLERTLAEFVARRATLHAPAQLSDSWLPPHALSGYFHSFAYLHAARALPELPAAQRASLGAALRKDVLARSEADGTWMDTIGLGKPYATAMALLVLELAEER
jgi:hypothetical protein